MADLTLLLDGIQRGEPDAAGETFGRSDGWLLSMDGCLPRGMRRA